MPATRDEANPRCDQIRELLPDFAKERLGIARSGEVQAHLFTCDSCTDLLSQIIMNATSSEPLRTPPAIPPQGIYDSYLRGRSGLLGVIYNRLTKAMHSADRLAAEWASKQVEAFGAALSTSLSQSQTEPGAIRARSAPEASRRSSITATVLSASFESTQESVEFAVDDGPSISQGGNFELKLTTTTAGYDGWWLACRVAAPGVEPVTFTGEIKDDGTGTRWRVAIEEPGVGSEAGAIAKNTITLFVARSMD
ncbi:MAG TPA: zf-HC2 domain-containing protein [Blastocatellia bacterium]|nr:zf-HC2 domain-containing protein [Blastocatellia bacterium]